MNKVQDEKFTIFLREKASEAERAIKYRPNYLVGMLSSDGGFQTASRLLAAPKVSEGFTRLWESGRLDLSVEALVVESEWREHFDPVLLEHAEKVLQQANYLFKRFQAPVSDTQSVLPSAAINPRRKNSLSFSAHCERLGAPLKNVADRWCGISDEKRRAVFTVWADRLHEGRYVFWRDADSPQDRRIGARELRQTIQAVMANGYEAYGILCEAVDPNAATRVRGYFQEDTVLVLRFATESPGLVAYVQGEAVVSDVLSGSSAAIAPFPSALDDLDASPLGVDRPDRVNGNRSGYRRDDAVRQHVLKRASGRCEHCGAQGFELPGGSYYVEAHHVISLADQGPDRVNNVIALCAHHHREAHYGRGAESLEASFTKKLHQLTGKSG
jgi:5-methylcytosine-specific restriction enzyme A